MSHNSDRRVRELRLRGLGRKNEGQVNDLNFPGSADRFAGLLHPLDSPIWSKTIVLRVQQAIAFFTRPIKKVSKKSAGPQNRTRDLKISHSKISNVVWGVYSSNLVTDRQTDGLTWFHPPPLIGRQKLLRSIFPKS